MDKKYDILVLSPHTDDAELGCGGSIVKFLEQGKSIYWIVFSTASESLLPGLPKNALKTEFQSVYSKLGLQKSQIEILNYKVRHLHRHRQEILEKLVNIRDTIQPSLVIGPSLNDLHQDHNVIAKEMIRAFMKSSSIISYELPWNHIEFSTQLFIQLKAKHIKTKNEILKNYNSQIQKGRIYFSSKFITGLARTRGSQINSEFAEAFEVIRWIN